MSNWIIFGIGYLIVSIIVAFFAICLVDGGSRDIDDEDCE